MRVLVYRPASGQVALGQTETTTFTITASDGIASAVIDNSTTVISTAFGVLAYSATTFVEAADNNGAIATTVTITLAGDTFTGANGQAIGTVSNVPAGLAASLIRTSDTTATLSFTGKASAHASAQDIANLTVTFDNSDFTLGNAAIISSVVRNNLVIDFADPSPATQTTVDGVKITTGTTVDAVTGLTQTVMTVPIGDDDRIEDPTTDHADLADIPLGLPGSTPEAGGVLGIGLPLAVGMTAQGPNVLLSGSAAMLDMNTRLADMDGQPDLLQHAATFLMGLGNDTLLSRTIVFDASTSTASTPGQIVVTGNTNHAEALVLDTNSLPMTASLQLDDIDFAAVFGAAWITGGAGNNVVVGDSAAQQLALGAGNDTVAGGGGNDVLSGAGSDVGRWEFYLNDSNQLEARHQAVAGAVSSAAEIRDAETLNSNQDILKFMDGQTQVLKDLSYLYQAAFGRQPDLRGLGHWAGQPMTVAEIAEAFLNSQEWVTLHGTQSNRDFVASLYANVLQRAGNDTELNFWVGALENTQTPLNRAQILLAFALGEENTTQTTTSNGIALGTTIVTEEQGWITGSGNDRLDGGVGNDRIVGGDGIDTVVYAGDLSDYRFLLTTDGEIRIADVSGAEKDTLVGIEFGEFGGTIINVSFTQIATEKLKMLGVLYQSVFDRSADLSGLQFWADLNFDARDYAANFLGSAEFSQLHGEPDNSAFVQILYRNSLGRDGSAQEVQTWNDYLGTHSRAELVGQWITLPEVLNTQYGTDGLWIG